LLEFSQSLIHKEKLYDDGVAVEEGVLDSKLVIG
jgi:hypothetical protein